MARMMNDSTRELRRKWRDHAKRRWCGCPYCDGCVFTPAHPRAAEKRLWRRELDAELDDAHRARQELSPADVPDSFEFWWVCSYPA